LRLEYFLCLLNFFSWSEKYAKLSKCGNPPYLVGQVHKFEYTTILCQFHIKMELEIYMDFEREIFLKPWRKWFLLTFCRHKFLPAKYQFEPGPSLIPITWAQFHQHSTYSFYARRSRKCKNSVKSSVSFYALGIYVRKSCL